MHPDHDLVPRAHVFDPSPDQADEALHDLACTYNSVMGVAAKHKVTIAALSAWTQRPDVKARLEAIEQFSLQRARMCAQDFLVRTIGALDLMIESYREEESNVPLERSLKGHAVRLRQRENARRAAALIERIASIGLPKSASRKSAPALAHETPSPVPQKSAGSASDFCAAEPHAPHQPTPPAAPAPNLEPHFHEHRVPAPTAPSSTSPNPPVPRP